MKQTNNLKKNITLKCINNKFKNNLIATFLNSIMQNIILLVIILCSISITFYCFFQISNYFRRTIQMRQQYNSNVSEHEINSETDTEQCTDISSVLEGEKGEEGEEGEKDEEKAF